MWAVGMAGGKRCKEMVMRWGDSCRAFPLLPERLEGMGTEGAAWKRCLRARILLRTLSLPEVFQHPVEYMAMERVIRRQRGMIEILGGIVEHPEPAAMRPCDGRLLSVVKATTSGSSRTLKAQPITLRAASRAYPCPSIRAGTASRFPRRA